MTAHAFTLRAYQALVASILARGYELRSFHDVAPGARHLVLRHDVDQSLHSARAMADAETSQGWRSTWFVLVRTEMYNVFSRAAVCDLRAMIAAGHEVGLHLDTSYYADPAAIEAGAALEARMLEDVLGSAIQIVSFHRPSPTDLDNDSPIAGRIHSYMSRFTRSMGYCSDSRGAWRHGPPTDHASIAAGTALQLLTHAVWWVGPDGRDAQQRLADVLHERTAALDRELAANNEIWRLAHQSPALLSRVPLPAGAGFVNFTPDLFERHAADCLAIAADVDGEYWKAEHFLADLPQKWRLSFAVLVDGIPVAYTVASLKAEQTVHLHHFMTRSDWRGRLLGKAMMAELLRRARIVDARRISLKVPIFRERLHALYSRLGFARTAIEGNYLLMRKELQ